MARNRPLAEKLYQEFLSNGGFTVKWPKDRRVSKFGSGSDGPFTVSIGRGQELKIPVDSFSVDDIDRYADTHAKFFRYPTLWLGGWEDKGLAYLDVSKVYRDTQRGYIKAQADAASTPPTPQIAIYDCGHMKQIKTGVSYERYLEIKDLPEDVQE